MLNLILALIPFTVSQMAEPACPTAVSASRPAPILVVVTFNGTLQAAALNPSSWSVHMSGYPTTVSMAEVSCDGHGTNTVCLTPGHWQPDAQQGDTVVYSGSDLLGVLGDPVAPFTVAISPET